MSSGKKSLKNHARISKNASILPALIFIDAVVNWIVLFHINQHLGIQCLNYYHSEKEYSHKNNLWVNKYFKVDVYSSHLVLCEQENLMVSSDVILESKQKLYSLCQ